MLLLSITALGLSLVSGFANQRGGICAVLAVEEALEQRCWERFLSFIECAGWALAIFLAMDALRFAALPIGGRHGPSAMIAGGAALFGAGAVVNGACAFGSVSRIGRGDTSYLSLVPGIAVGSIVVSPLADAGLWQDGTYLVTEPVIHLTMAVAVAVFVLWRLRRVLSAVRSVRSILDTLRRPRWAPTLAMAVIAAANVPLILMFGSWSPRVQLMEMDPSGGSDLAVRTILAAALVGGATIAAMSSGRFRLRRPMARPVLRSFLGGILMGAGGVMIPGGNDQLILHGLPLLGLHAFIAYVAMVATIFLLVAVQMHQRPLSAKRSVPVADSHGRISS